MEGNYIVMVVTLIVWVGLFTFIFGVDKKVKKLEEKSR